MGFYCTPRIGVILFLCFTFTREITSVVVEDNVLTAYISENGLKGVINFRKGVTDDIVIVTAFVKNLHGNPAENITWNIRQLPVDYTTFNLRCSDKQLGPVHHNLDYMFGRLKLNENVQFSASDDVIPLTGPQGIWQSSIVLELPDGRRACSTLTVSEGTDVRIGKAKFYGPVFGTIHFFWIGITGSETDAVILTDIHHVHKHQLVDSEHKWGIFVTDILETKRDKTKLECDALQFSYNGMDDLSFNLGKLKAGQRTVLRDPTFAPIDLYQMEHTYYVAVYDDVHKDSFSSCAPLLFLPELVLKSRIESHSTKANITFSQRSPFDPTTVSYNINSPFIQNVGGVRIHTLPFIPNYYDYREHKCFGIKDVFNPTGKGIGAGAPLSGNSTQDMYAVGDLSGKLENMNEIQWDIFLPLSGPNSVLHKTIAIYVNTHSGIEEPWLCEILVPVAHVKSNIKLPMVTAEVIFQYPVAGRIVFRQLANQEYSDTIIIVESLLYSDGSVEADSFHHNWTINEMPPTKDYYSWENRCYSSGPVFNPFKVLGNGNYGPVNYFDYSKLASVLGTFTIVARKSRAVELSRQFFIHPNLPLTGPHSIMGKSLVIYDENGPKARGNRLACSKILPVNRRKAVVRDWFGNGEQVNLIGDIEMYQTSEYDAVDVEIYLQGLQNVNDYHIHMVSVDEELEFPCENSSLYDVWNPLNVTGKVSNTTVKTDDLFRMGDLSGKYGDWSDLTVVDTVHNDSNLQMFGRHSLLGRSLVIHKRIPSRRWACASIERGYSPAEARELRAIASFHHPLGFVYGYIRMIQLIHIDGSKSDTVIEVNLRHPGKQNRNVTRNHLWLVYVNSVGVDATVESTISRCTAAGYVWNPYFIQLAAPLNDDLYYQECGPDQPYRCYAGDLSGRLGPISVGTERQVFSDPNLPLEGEISVMGKSIVILDRNLAHRKFSCANIEPDKDIIKYANIQKSPRFVLIQFLTDLREILGTPEWMLTVDNRKTKYLYNGACIQLMFHFKGPNANQLEMDFSKLMRTGKLAAPTIYNPGYVPPTSQKKVLNYHLCSTRETISKKKQYLYAGTATRHETPLQIIFYLSFITLNLVLNVIY